MAIYDIFEEVEKETEQLELPLGHRTSPRMEMPKDKFFSSVAARLFFALLLLADILWSAFSLIRFVALSLMHLAFGLKNEQLKKYQAKSWLNVKRSLICGLSLFVTLFSPALGVMFACTYFLMYDKSGIEEVVPSVLQAHFKDFFEGQ